MPLSVFVQALANKDANGCQVSIPVHYAGALVAGAGAAVIISRSKKQGGF
jgi:hypothetical protein